MVQNNENREALREQYAQDIRDEMIRNSLVQMHTRKGGIESALRGYFRQHSFEVKVINNKKDFQHHTFIKISSSVLLVLRCCCLHQRHSCRRRTLQSVAVHLRYYIYNNSAKLNVLTPKLSANQSFNSVILGKSFSSVSLNRFVTLARVISPLTGADLTLDGKLNNTTASCNRFIYCSGCGTTELQTSQKAYISRANNSPPGVENRCAVIIHSHRWAWISLEKVLKMRRKV